MKRLLFVWLSAGLLAGGLTASPSVAQEPSLDHYRILPRLSTLRQTGGFAGLDLRYRLIGEYDFRDGTRPTEPAAFENAEVWGSLISDDPTPAVVIDVDEILNLEGLRGTQLPVAAPFDVYRFKGSTSDDSSVELFAAVLGDWMYIHGGTTPPPGSADFFEYDIRALARSRPFADFNGNGVVDAADYTVMRDSGWAGGKDETAGAGFKEWQQQFGESIPDLKVMDAALSAAAASFVAAAAVPEPTCLGFAIGCGLVVAGLWRRRGQ